MRITIKKPSLLLMFSGGLDSLAALHLLLTTQPEPIHVHHVHLSNIENRTQAEHNAVDAVRAYYEQAGAPLDYSESYMQYPVVNGSFFYDTDVTHFMSAYIAARAPITSVAFGYLDIDRLNMQRLPTANVLFEAMAPSIPRIYPIAGWSKQQVYDSLPPELRELAWSCRRPIYFEDKSLPCGRCKTCKAMKRINRGTS